MLTTDVYVHSDKGTMYQVGKELGLSSKALETFVYTGYEVKLTINIDESSGDSDIIKVDDRVLEDDPGRMKIPQNIKR